MKNKKTKVLVFGNSGLLGGEFLNFFSPAEFSVSGYDSKTCDIAKFDLVLKIIKKTKPDIVVNCAGKISLAECDNDPLGSYMDNSIGPGNIARALKILNKKSVFFQISTSYVFGGRSAAPCVENAEAKPGNVYSWSKLLGEKIVEQELENCNSVRYHIIRTGWLYGGFRRTFIEEFADSLMEDKTVKLVSDNYNVPTWTKDLVEASIALWKDEKSKSGIYHLFNSYKKPVAKYDIGIFIASILGTGVKKIEPCLYADVSKVGRLGNDLLINTKTKALPDWKKSLADYLKSKYKKSF